MKERETGATIRVDLLPTERRRWRLDPAVIVLALLVLTGNLGFAMYGQHLDVRIDTARVELKQAQDERARLAASLPVIEERRAHLRKLKDQIAMIQGLVHDPVRYANLLQEIGYRLPPNVWLGSLSIDPASNTVQVSGTAAAAPGKRPLATVSSLMANLNRSRYFQDATLGSTSRTGPDFAFHMSIHYDPQAAAEVAPGSDRTEVRG